jgi:hypothetical protein
MRNAWIIPEDYCSDFMLLPKRSAQIYLLSIPYATADFTEKQIISATGNHTSHLAAIKDAIAVPEL